MKWPLCSKSIIENDDKNRDPQRWRDLVAFWVLGMCNNYGYVIMLSAAHDIIKSLDSNGNEPANKQPEDERTRPCQTMSVGAILLADIVPALLMNLISPFFPFFINLRVLFIITAQCAGFLFVAFATHDWMAITGVVLTSINLGLGEATFLPYASRFHKNVVSTWSSGTGGAGVLGSFSYAALISVGLSPTNTMLIMLAIPIIEGYTFWIVLRDPDEIPSHESESQNPQAIGMQDSIGTKEEEEQEKEFSFIDKIRYMPSLLKYMIPLFLVYFAEYFINQGLLELVYFKNIWIDHASQYRWLQVDYQIGVFISRSSVTLFQIHRIWLIAVFQFVNVAIVLTEVLTFFSPTIWIIFAVVFWEGLLAGAIYVNTYFRMTTEVPENRQIFSMGIVPLADAIGVMMAGIAAMPVHNKICGIPMPIRS